MSRTTDPLAAITALLESSDPDTVIQYDGISYRVAPSGDKREGFYEILRWLDVMNMMAELMAQCPDLKGLTANCCQGVEMIDAVAKLVERDSETWMRSARYNESLATTASDQAHPTNN